jgi:spermidine synthase
MTSTSAAVPSAATAVSARLSGRDSVLILGLAVLFFVSGACALVYQVLWLRMLGWVFGVTVYAASAVWAVFMTGLGVGSFIAGRLADRVRRPLAWFGAIEILIGGSALATPQVMQWLQQTYVALYPALPHSIAGLTAVRIALTFACLIVPTVLMGTTLPLVVKGSTFRSGRFGAQVGLLYGSNATGAIVGTLIAGLSLIPARGIHGTFLVAASANLLVGLGAIALSLAGARPSADAPAVRSPGAGPAGPRSDRTPTDRRLLVVLGVFALSGVISMALEVVWFRVLTLFLRPTVYGFSVMLATVLTGISAGSYLITPFLGRRARWLLVLALLELAIAVTAVLSFRPISNLSVFSRMIEPFVARIVPAWLSFSVAGSVLTILPTALLMGIAFPVGLYLWSGRGTADNTHSARRLGLFYSLNVVGGIVGSLLGGFVLLPLVGSRASLILLAGLCLCSGLALLVVAESGRRTKVIIGSAALVVFGGAVRWSPDPFTEFVAQRYPRQDGLWKEEGVETTVVVHRRPGELSLTVNGNHEASTGGSMTFVHRRIGHLPMALHPNPRTALVIGLGGGATAGAVSVHDGVTVDIVELSGAVVRGAKFFEGINYGVHARPNVTFRVDDGRNYLMLAPRRYDVITADIIIPIFAGSGNLYSQEYFRLMRRALNPGGIAMQWVNGTDAEYKLIARTFQSVFPNTTAWAGGELLVGSVEPLRISRTAFEAKLRRPGHAQGLRDLGVGNFQDLLASFTAGPEELRAFVGDGPLLSDDRPLTEYFLSLPRDTSVDFSQLRPGNVSKHVTD